MTSSTAATCGCVKASRAVLGHYGKLHMVRLSEAADLALAHMHKGPDHTQVSLGLVGWDGMGWDGMGWDEMGWGGMRGWYDDMIRYQYGMVSIWYGVCVCVCVM